jgi:hypothetical protein
MFQQHDLKTLRRFETFARIMTYFKSELVSEAEIVNIVDIEFKWRAK